MIDHFVSHIMPWQIDQERLALSLCQENPESQELINLASKRVE